MATTMVHVRVDEKTRESQRDHCEPGALRGR